MIGLLTLCNKKFTDKEYSIKLKHIVTLESIIFPKLMMKWERMLSTCHTRSSSCPVLCPHLCAKRCRGQKRKGFRVRRPTQLVFEYLVPLYTDFFAKWADKRNFSLHVGLRGAVEPELVMEVELSSWSWYPRRLRMACRGREDLLSGLHEPPSWWDTNVTDRMDILRSVIDINWKLKQVWVGNISTELSQLQCYSIIHLP